MFGEAQQLVRLAELLEISADVLRELLALRASVGVADDLDDMAADLGRIATRVRAASVSSAHPSIVH